MLTEDGRDVKEGEWMSVAMPAVNCTEESGEVLGHQGSPFD